MITTEPIPQKPLETFRAAGLNGRGKLAYAAMAVATLGLALTGIGTFATGKAPMTGWVLMAHVAIAPLFALGLASVALTWADGSRFGPTGSRQSGAAKALLWLILLCGLVVILSAVVPMTPLFGTNGQHALYLTHRYSAIVLACAMVLHLLAISRASAPQRTSTV